jgi:hypothetical protein
LVNGKPNDPRRVLRNTDGTPLPTKYAAEFARRRDDLFLSMGRTNSGLATALVRAN